jgi:hypothetical protein
MTNDDANPPAPDDASAPDEPPAPAEQDERTVVVDRSPEESTVVVDREPVESTVVIARDEPTRDEATVVVDRDAESTVVVDRDTAAPPTDGTVAVTRNRVTSALPPAIGGSRRRRGMTMPAVAPGFGRGAIDAVGPGAIATYEPRAIPAPPVVPELLPGSAATRIASPALPSVRRRTRALGAAALAVFGVACVVSIVGLVALGILVFG